MELDVQKLVDECAAAGGGVVQLPRGMFDVPRPIDIPDRVIVRGAGASYGALSATVLVFLPDVAPEACVYLSGAGAQLLDVAIQGPSFHVRSRIGVFVRGHASLCRSVSCHFMTDFGFYVHANVAEQTNANSFALERCRAARCGKAGYYVNGAECNAGRVEGCTADGNEGYGFFESGFLGNEYAGCHASNNPRGNYAQGGSIEEPLQGGVSNYSIFVGCYTEGSTPCPMRAAQIHVSGGNLLYSVSGWPDANGAPTPFPGTKSGARSKLIFEDGPIKATTPAGNLRALVHALVDGDAKPWLLARAWEGSPAWLKDTLALLQYDKSGWAVPFASTREAHPAGPGRRVYGSPLVSTPFRFVVKLGVSLAPSAQWLVHAIPAPLLTHDLTPASAHVVRCGFREAEASGPVEIGSHRIDLANKKILVRLRAPSGGSGELIADVERVWAA